MRRITYRKAAAVAMAAALSAALLVGCGSTAASTDSAATSTVAGESAAESTAEDAEKTADSASGSGSVYYLNFKPEQDQAWQDLAGIYTEQTGVPVTVITAADGTYEQTLKSEMAKLLHYFR